MKVPRLVSITNKRGEKSEIVKSSPYKRKLKNDQWRKTKKAKKETRKSLKDKK